MGWGYTCFVSAFAVFVSEKEIKIQKSQVIKFFDNVSTEALFNELKLPIKKIHVCEDGTENKAFEIDLSHK